MSAGNYQNFKNLKIGDVFLDRKRPDTYENLDSYLIRKVISITKLDKNNWQSIAFPEVLIESVKFKNNPKCYWSKKIDKLSYDAYDSAVVFRLKKS